MKSKVYPAILKFIRKLTGVERVLDRLTLMEHRLNNVSRLTYMNSYLLQKFDSENAHSETNVPLINLTKEESAHFQLVSLLSPMDVVGSKYIRIGSAGDGGYVMLDIFSKAKVDVAYSLGIGNDVSWDMDIAEKGIDIFMYDHTLEYLPLKHQRFHFFKTGIGRKYISSEFEELESEIRKNGHENCENILLKVDIEGAEWPLFADMPEETMKQFVQIVIELHGVTVKDNIDNAGNLIRILSKINNTHQSVHVHANPCTKVNWLHGIPLPDSIEVTYIRRDENFKFIENTRDFPTILDSPNCAWQSDVPLGKFTNPKTFTSMSL